MTASIVAVSLLPMKGKAQEQNMGAHKSKGFSGWTIDNDTDTTNKIKTKPLMSTKWTIEGDTFTFESVYDEHFNKRMSGIFELIQQPLWEAAKAQGYTDEQIKEYFMNDSKITVAKLAGENIRSGFKKVGNKIYFLPIEVASTTPFTILHIGPAGGYHYGLGFCFLILEDLDKDGYQTKKSKIIAISDSKIAVTPLKNGTFKLTYSLGIDKEEKEEWISLDETYGRDPEQGPALAQYGWGGKERTTIIDANGAEIKQKKQSFAKMFKDIGGRD